MKRFRYFYAVSFVIVVLAAGACGTDKQKQPKQEDVAPAKKIIEEKIIEEKIITEKSKVKLISVFEGTTEGEAGKGTIVINLHEKEIITGKLCLQKNCLELNGAKQEEDLRVWATLDDKDPNKFLSGWLLGKYKDGNPEGSFIISGNSGKPILNGTWSAIKK